MPELALARRGRDVRLTLAVARRARRRARRARRARSSGALAGLRRRPLPMLDPAPAGRFPIASTAPPEHYEAAVARAVERIRAGAFEKIVLAREVAVHAPAPHDTAAVFGVLRAGFASCYVYCAGRGDAAFVGASPELLVRREGLRASTVALAGSTRRSADPAVDDPPRRAAPAVREGPRGAGDRHPPDRPRAAAAQRLGRRARRAGDRARGEHPAPRHADPRAAHAAAQRGRAGRPAASDARRSAASRTRSPTPQIPAFEGLDRGWYAGPVGWTDANEDGEFCVALRCALLRGAEARLYAGVGVVRDSDPAAELAETEVKLGALLPVLSG